MYRVWNRSDVNSRIEGEFTMESIRGNIASMIEGQTLDIKLLDFILRGLLEDDKFLEKLDKDRLREELGWSN